MTLLSNLRDFQNHIVAFQTGSYWKGLKVKSLYDQIFPESTILYRCAFCLKFFYFFIRQKADLTMPVSCVGVILQSIIFNSQPSASRISTLTLHSPTVSTV